MIMNAVLQVYKKNAYWFVYITHCQFPIFGCSFFVVAVGCHSARVCAYCLLMLLLSFCVAGFGSPGIIGSGAEHTLDYIFRKYTVDID